MKCRDDVESPLQKEDFVLKNGHSFCKSQYCTARGKWWCRTNDIGTVPCTRWDTQAQAFVRHQSGSSQWKPTAAPERAFLAAATACLVE